MSRGRDHALYLFFQKGTRQFYIADISKVASQRDTSFVAVDLRLKLNQIKPRLVTGISRASSGEFQRLAINDGVVASVSNGALEKALQNYRGSDAQALFLDVSSEPVSLIGLSMIHRWQGLQLKELEQTLGRVVEGYRRFIVEKEALERGTYVLPVQHYIPEAFRGVKEVSSWYIPAIKRIYAAQGKLNMLGFNPQSRELFGYDHGLKKVVSVQLVYTSNGDDAGVSREGYFPAMAVYSDYQFEHQSLYTMGDGIYVKGSDGLTFRLKRNGRILVALDLTTEVSSTAPEKLTLSGLPGALAQTIHNKFQRLSGMNVEIAPEVELDLPKGLPGFQAWYHTGASLVATEGVTVYQGSEPVVMLGGTGVGRDKTSWFYASDSGNLYRQADNGQALVGNFPEVSASVGGGSLAITGTSGDDHFVDIRIGSSDTQPVLHLQGEGGADHFECSRDAVRHYSAIVVDTSITQGDKPAGSSRSGELPVSTVAIDLPANEFSAVLGVKALQLYHFPTGHTLSFPAPYNWQAMNSGQFDDFRFTTGETHLSFSGFQVSFSELLATALQQPDIPWQLPVDIGQLPDGTRLGAHPDHPLKLQIPQGYRLTGFDGRRKRGLWTLSFDSKSDKKRIEVDDPGFRAARRGQFWISHPRFDDHLNPAKHIF